MTSKEFIRRLDYWSNWLSAFESFSNHPEFPCIWRISVSEFMARHVCFFVEIPIIDSLFSEYEIDTLIVERYYYDRFKIDLRFFKSFLSKLTPYQLAVLQHDSRFIPILNYLSNERKK